MIQRWIHARSIATDTCRSGYSELTAFQCLTVFEWCRTESVKKLIRRPITISGATYRIIGDAYRISATENTSTTKIRISCITVLPATNICRIMYWGNLTIRLSNTLGNTYNSASVFSPIHSDKYEYRTNVFCRIHESLTTTRFWRKSFSRGLNEHSQTSPGDTSKAAKGVADQLLDL